jgi:hypothetical protein
MFATDIMVGCLWDELVIVDVDNQLKNEKEGHLLRYIYVRKSFESDQNSMLRPMSHTEVTTYR